MVKALRNYYLLLNRLQSYALSGLRRSTLLKFAEPSCDYKALECQVDHGKTRKSRCAPAGILERSSGASLFPNPNAYPTRSTSSQIYAPSATSYSNYDLFQLH